MSSTQHDGSRETPAIPDSVSTAELGTKPPPDPVSSPAKDGASGWGVGARWIIMAMLGALFFLLLWIFSD